jgi:hypothetical protein
MTVGRRAGVDTVGDGVVVAIGIRVEGLDVEDINVGDTNVGSIDGPPFWQVARTGNNANSVTMPMYFISGLYSR